jgi:DNA-binding transcriptional ArsR family regulator
MPDLSPRAVPVASSAGWNEDLIFSLLADPVRRRLLLNLARCGVGQAASQLNGGVGRRLDATLKHLTALRNAGLLVTQPDKVDARRMLYSLSPAVPLVKTETGSVIDFGFCSLRL